MGSVTALGIQDSVLDLETQLAYHLQGNHYPPVPLSMVKPCIDAIDAYYDEDYERFIAMPEGVFYKGMSHAPASAIVEQHHLEFWLPQEEYYGEEDSGFEEWLGLE